MSAVRQPDPLVEDLKQWAQKFLELEGLGHADSSPIWRALFASGGGGFRSMVPSGVYHLEMPSRLLRMFRVLEDLTADESPQIYGPVACVQLHYLVGPERIRKETGRSRAAIYNLVTTGEALIRREFSR